MLICPNCGESLIKNANTLKCANNHSFDIASAGYCNLLVGSKAGEFRGDTKEMVMARRNFLDSGAYEPLQKAVCDAVYSLSPSVIIDAGCGEGYYTRAVAEKLSQSGDITIIGADISKTATQYAAKRDKVTTYITASCFHMPVQSACADLVLSLFAPSAAEEFSRVLKPEGRVLQVVPGDDHLWELKEAVYENAYKNREEKHTLEGFELISRNKITYRRTIDSPDLIKALFSMTPYVHRTPKEGIDRLNALENIDLTMSFLLLTFQKI